MERIIIIDYGSQYTQLLARRVREYGVYSEVIPPNKEINLKNVKGIILSGGPESVYSDNAPKLNTEIFNYNIPILGVCYGMQLIAQNLGCEVKKENNGEYGRTEIIIEKKDLLFNEIPNKITTWMSHGDNVINLRADFEPLAKTKNGIIAGFRLKSKNIWGIQFHPEVRHSEFGNDIIENFVLDICKMKGDWSLSNFVDDKIKEIREKIGNKKAIIALSGGVDSSVAAVLVHKAIGSNLKAVFVDHGLLRKNEPEEVRRIFKEMIGLDLLTVKAKDRFLNKLKNVSDPEEKRKIIGEEFIRVFEKVAKENEDIEYLIQGTIYSDVIESAASGSNTSVIKSHHNVGGLPEKMNLKIFEPLREIFKDEVRSTGELLSIPKHILYRHPFPGPGLAIRIIGEITEKKLEILKNVDSIFIETLKENNWYNKVWQSFAVLTPVKTVGVAGDTRKYEYVVSLRSVDSVEGMTADWSRIPFDILNQASNRITNEVPEVGRVVYDITSKPPATIEWE
ncbi:MAG: glutamine-hydrolyzing GMP synthase [Thermotogota bacterium]